MIINDKMCLTSAVHLCDTEENVSSDAVWREQRTSCLEMKYTVDSYVLYVLVINPS